MKMNDVDLSLTKVHARTENINAKIQALSPVQEEVWYANSIFWSLDSSKDIAKQIHSFSMSAIIHFMNIF